MTNSNSRQDLDHEPLPPYLRKKQEESSEVYELSPMRGTRLFSYIGKAAFVCFIIAALYFTVFWFLHRSHSAVSQPAAAASVIGTPTVKPVTLRPPEVGYVGVWGISSSGATVSWSTNVPATTTISFGASSSALDQSTQEEKKFDVTHGVSLKDLKSGTTYYFVARSTDETGVTGSSSVGSFTTRSVGVPPVLSSVLVEPGNNNQARISWVTSKPSYSYFEAGPNTTYGQWSTKSELTTNAHCSVNWIRSGTVHYHLVSTDAEGNKTVSPDYTFVEP